MLVARAVLADGGGVAGRDVADVAREPVARIERVQPAHDAVARHLGDDRGGGDRGALGVAVDDRAMLRRERPEPEAVDEAGLRRRREVGEDGAQAPEVRLVEAVPVDVGAGDDADADPRCAADDGAEELLALGGRDLLRVVQRRERADAVIRGGSRSRAARRPRRAALRASRGRPRRHPRRSARRASGRRRGASDRWDGARLRL